jgi:hypothetical protein
LEEEKQKQFEITVISAQEKNAKKLEAVHDNVDKFWQFFVYVGLTEITVDHG